MSTISEPRRLRHIGRLLAIAALVSPCIALAGPWEVGSTSPGKQKKVKAEVTWKHAGSKDVWGRPVLKYAAPLARDVSYEVAGGYGIIDRKDGPTRSGSRDLTAKLKWRFAGETDRRPAFLVEPKFTFATGDGTSGVGGGVTTIKTPVRAGKQFGPFRVTAEVFYKHGFAHDYTDMIGYGGLLEYAPNPTLTVGVDLVSDRPAAFPAAERHPLPVQRPSCRGTLTMTLGRAHESRRYPCFLAGIVRTGRGRA